MSMREYGKVYSQFWSSATVAGLSDDGKLLALYLMTCSHNTIAGVFRGPDGYICEDMKWSAERVVEGFRELSDKGFAKRCERSKWVWVIKHLEWNPPENPNQRKSAAKVSSGIPVECAWRIEFLTRSGASLGLEPLDDGCETLEQGFPNQEQEQEQEQKEKPCASDDAGGQLEDRRAPTRLPDPPGFAEFWTAWPKTDRKQDRKKCVEKWRRSKFAAQVAAILAHVEEMKRSKKWRDGFEPAPLTYLNGERWKDLVGDADEAPATTRDYI